MVKIAVIGAGASGMTATKQAIDQGFEVIVFEKTNYTGGLWRYQETDKNGLVSVMKSTITNSSKEMSAFSNFPPKETTPNFMHHSKMVTYLDEYCSSFNFKQYVRFLTEVINVEPADNFQETGQWKVSSIHINEKLKFKKNQTTVNEFFDGVMICSGRYSAVNVPTFKGQEKYKGIIIHSNSLKTVNNFENKKVVVVGMGNSGGDAAVELSLTAKQVYLSTRSGTWLFHRNSYGGRPFDQLIYLSQTPFINDNLANKIISGNIIIKKDIEQFAENGIIFKNDNGQITQCETVVLCTGYKIVFPFLSSQVLPQTQDNQFAFYKHQFLPHLQPHPHTLAFIGLVEPSGALFPIAELQSRWFVLLMATKIPMLPPHQTMNALIKRQLQKQRSFYRVSISQNIQVDWLSFTNELAAEIGVLPALTRYFLTDPKLWEACMFGPSAAYQYRLEGPNKWIGAREAMITIQRRINAPFKY
ncbi:hypothetical protein TYRP_022604, partial [Tyrophagus putrescentiae]